MWKQEGKHAGFNRGILGPQTFKTASFQIVAKTIFFKLSHGKLRDAEEIRGPGQFGAQRKERTPVLRRGVWATYHGGGGASWQRHMHNLSLAVNEEAQICDWKKKPQFCSLDAGLKRQTHGSRQWNLSLAVCQEISHVCFVEWFCVWKQTKWKHSPAKFIAGVFLSDAPFFSNQTHSKIHI